MIIGFDASRAFLKQNTGTENYSLNLLKALARTDKKNRYRVYLRKIPGSKFSMYKLCKEFPKNFEFRLITPNKLWTQFSLALETWRSPVDLLFVPAHTLPVLRNYRVKTVVTIHDLGVEYLPNFHKFPQRYYLDFASKYAARSADRLIAVSRQTARDLRRRYGIEKDKTEVVYEGVDKAVFKRKSKAKIKIVKQKYKLQNYFLYVGTVQPRKNLMFLIDTFSTFVKTNNVKDKASIYNKSKQGIKLVIAGKYGWDYDEIVSISQRLGISDRVVFLGYVPRDDLVALYSGAKALLFPSLFEGFGLPILEALSCGCPVIASDIPVHREIHKITTGYLNSTQANSLKTTGYISKNLKYKIENLNHSHKSDKTAKPEAMLLANPRNRKKWVELLYQNLTTMHQRPFDPISRDFGKIFWSWDRVARQTTIVFNRVVDNK